MARKRSMMIERLNDSHFFYFFNCSVNKIIQKGTIPPCEKVA